jgi:CheY-like chemotaxis protein
MDSAKTPLTILVVDDMEATLNMLKTGLRRSGHTVLTALSGREALTVFNENHIDFVICDLGMPGMNGWQVAQHLKSICHERSVPKTPLIILTGWEDQVDETEKISQSGVDAVVQKPVEISALIRVIQDVLMTRISVHRRCLVQK